MIETFLDYATLRLQMEGGCTLIFTHLKNVLVSKYVLGHVL